MALSPAAQQRGSQAAGQLIWRQAFGAASRDRVRQHTYQRQVRLFDLVLQAHVFNGDRGLAANADEHLRILLVEVTRGPVRDDEDTAQSGPQYDGRHDAVVQLLPLLAASARSLRMRTCSLPRASRLSSRRNDQSDELSAMAQIDSGPDTERPSLSAAVRYSPRVAPVRRTQALRMSSYTSPPNSARWISANAAETVSARCRCSSPHWRSCARVGARPRAVSAADRVRRGAVAVGCAVARQPRSISR